MSSIKSDLARAKSYFQGEVGLSPMINKLGITQQAMLDKAEAFYVEMAHKQGFSKQAQVLSADGLKQMHKEMFGDVYAWAGTYRDYTTGRGVPFCLPQYIEANLAKLYNKLNQQIHPNMNKQDFIKMTAEFIGELNAIHPFIDGNGRTQREVLAIIADKAGFLINVNKFDRNSWYQSAEEAHLSATYQGFESILSLAMIIPNSK